MKLLEKFPLPSIEVNYFGLVLQIPRDIKWIATDEDGMICGYKAEPTLFEGLWADRLTNFHLHIARVDLSGKDWKQTLVEVD